jgi:hypothetical protein
MSWRCKWLCLLFEEHFPSNLLPIFINYLLPPPIVGHFSSSVSSNDSGLPPHHTLYWSDSSYRFEASLNWLPNSVTFQCTSFKTSEIFAASVSLKYRWCFCFAVDHQQGSRRIIAYGFTGTSAVGKQNKKCGVQFYSLDLVKTNTPDGDGGMEIKHTFLYSWTISISSSASGSLYPQLANRIFEFERLTLTKDYVILLDTNHLLRYVSPQIYLLDRQNGKLLNWINCFSPQLGSPIIAKTLAATQWELFVLVCYPLKGSREAMVSGSKQCDQCKKKNPESSSSRWSTSSESKALFKVYDLPSLEFSRQFPSSPEIDHVQYDYRMNSLTAITLPDFQENKSMWMNYCDEDNVGRATHDVCEKFYLDSGFCCNYW